MMGKSQPPGIAAGEQGFVLVAGLLLLLILSIVGILVVNSSITEIQVAGNDKLQKQTFTQADGGTELGGNLLEYNFSCGAVTSVNITSKITVEAATNNFFANDITTWKGAHPDPPADYPADNFRDLCWANPPASAAVNCAAVVPGAVIPEHTNVKMIGRISLNPGSAIQMAAGYEGKGKGTAGGGAVYLHEIHSQTLASLSNEAVIRTEWRHLVGQEDPAGCY